MICNGIREDMTVSDIAYEVGFNDPKYFTRCFTQQFGLAPSIMISEFRRASNQSSSSSESSNGSVLKSIPSQSASISRRSFFVGRPAPRSRFTKNVS